MAPRFGRPSSYPGSRPVVELDGRHLHGSFNLIGIGKTLASEGMASKEAAPAFLEIEPACALGNEDVLEARMVCEPDARLQAVMTTQVVGDDEDSAFRIVSLDVLLDVLEEFEECNVILGVTRRGASGDLLAIADAQRSIDPHLVIPVTVLQRSLDPMTIH